MPFCEIFPGTDPCKNYNFQKKFLNYYQYILYMKSGREASNRRDWLKGIALIGSRLAALVLRGNSNNNVKFYNVKL